MKNKIKQFLFGIKQTTDVEEKAYICKSSPSVYNTIVPGNMTIDEWRNGGYSRWNHPEINRK